MRALLPVSLFAASLAAQSTNDIGLTVDGGGLAVSYGQVCGPVPCQPLAGPTIVPGTTRYVTQNAAPWSPYAIAIGAPPTNGCVPIPGIANGLLLEAPIVIFAGGVTGPPVPVFGLCPRGVATVLLVVPVGTPSGFAFVLQSVGVDWAGQLGFSNGIAAVVQ